MVEESKEERKKSIKTRRRQFLEAAGIIGMTGLAGCGGDSGNDTPTESSTPTDGSDTVSNGNSGNGGETKTATQASGNGGETKTATQAGEPVDPMFSTHIGSNPIDVQYNPFNTTAPSSAQVEAVIFEPLVKFDKPNREWIPVIISDWTIDGGTVDLQLNDQYVWHNGDPVTAEDLAVQFRLNLVLNNPISNFVSSVKVTGDHSLQLTLTNDTINTDILFMNVLDTRLKTKAAIFRSHLDSIQQAETTPAVKSAKKNLLEMRIEEPVGTGPFKFDSADTQRVLTVKHEDYPGAGQINFPRYEFLYLSGNQQRWQALMTGVTDGEAHMGITKNVLEQMPDHVDLIRPPEKGGTSLVFQHKDTVFSDPRVRKAVTYALNGDVLTDDSTLNYQFRQLAMNTGMMPSQAKNYLSEEVRSSLTNYDIEPQSQAEQRATELLKSAGFTQKNGNWMTPEGNRFKLPIKTIGSWWSIQAQSITGQLRDFGIDASFVSESLGSFFGDLGSGNYVMAISFFSGRHPYQSLSTVFDLNNSSTMHVPNEIKVPMPVGNPSGDIKTINIQNKLKSIRNSRDDSEIQRLVSELAWAYNQYLPRVPHLIGTGMTFMTDDAWEYPPLDDPTMKIFFPPYWLLRTGGLKAETK